MGSLGRRALHSLTALGAEFVGSSAGSWVLIARRLTDAGQIEPHAAEGAAMLWAVGTLIGNTDMHSGNVSFIAEHGRPYAIAPAYDMMPMAFAPRSGGLPVNIAVPNIQADVPNDIWRRAEILAREFLVRVRASNDFSPRFGACVGALENHLNAASAAIAQLG